MVAVPPEAWDTWRNTSVPLMCSRDCASVLVIAKGHRVPTSPSPHSPSQNLPIQIFFFKKKHFYIFNWYSANSEPSPRSWDVCLQKSLSFPNKFFQVQILLARMDELPCAPRDLPGFSRSWAGCEGEERQQCSILPAVSPPLPALPRPPGSSCQAQGFGSQLGKEPPLPLLPLSSLAPN